MEIKILDVFTPSEKQKASGIEGTVNLGLEHDNVLIIRANGITIRKAKSGNMFLSEPSYSVGDGDDKKWWKHFMLYPGPRGEEGETQRNAKDALTSEVLRVLESGGTKRKESPVTTTSNAAPARDPW